MLRQRYGLSLSSPLETKGKYPSKVSTIGVPKPVTSIAMLYGRQLATSCVTGRSRNVVIPVSVLDGAFAVNAKQNVVLALIDAKRDEGGAVQDSVCRAKLHRWRCGHLRERLSITPLRWHSRNPSGGLARSLLLPEVFHQRGRDVIVGTFGVSAPGQSRQEGCVGGETLCGSCEDHHTDSHTFTGAVQRQGVDGSQTRRGTAGIVGICGETCETRLTGEDGRSKEASEPDD